MCSYLPHPPYLLQLWLMSFLPRAAWNSSRRNFVGCDTGVRPEQTNTDLSGLRLEERGFRVKRVALAATGTPRLKANKSRHVSSPLLVGALSARCLPLYLDITVTHFYFGSQRWRSSNRDLLDWLLSDWNSFIFKWWRYYLFWLELNFTTTSS